MTSEHSPPPSNFCLLRKYSLVPTREHTQVSEEGGGGGNRGMDLGFLRSRSEAHTPYRFCHWDTSDMCLDTSDGLR
jgi:hypothetical protein